MHAKAEAEMRKGRRTPQTSDPVLDVAPRILRAPLTRVDWKFLRPAGVPTAFRDVRPRDGRMAHHRRMADGAQ